MEPKKQPETNGDFEVWKLDRFEVAETHQAEFALK